MQNANKIHKVKNVMAGFRSWGKNAKKTKFNKEEGIAYKVSPRVPPHDDA
jgi:hypothetical protein